MSLDWREMNAIEDALAAGIRGMREVMRDNPDRSEEHWIEVITGGHVAAVPKGPMFGPRSSAHPV